MNFEEITVRNSGMAISLPISSPIKVIKLIERESKTSTTKESAAISFKAMQSTQMNKKKAVYF